MVIAAELIILVVHVIHEPANWEPANRQ